MTTLCLLALATPVPPQLEPYELVNRTVGHRLKHVRAADFDHDGRLDLLSASETDGRVLYHRNLGSAGFETATEIARKDKVGVPDLEALDAVDLDVDGNVDAVYVFAEVLHWRQGHGDGTFAPEEELGPMLGAGGLEFVDFDGDGWLDVFGFSRGVRTLWGTGPGEFIPGHMSGVPSALTPVRRLAFADFDGDGAMDLAFQAADEWTGGFLPTLVDGLVGVRYQVAPRALGAVDVLFPLGGTEGTDLFAVDIDDDGRIDVLQQSGSRIHLFRNSAVGFESRTILADRYRTRELLVADVDLDGDDELVTVEGDHPYGFGPQEIVTHAQDPAGTFSVAHVFTSVGEAATSPSFVDLDGDGRLDLLHASSHDDLLLFHQAEASGGYAPPVEITDRFRLSPSDPNVGVVDLDADGLVDVVALGHEDVRFALQEPDGSFGRTLPTGWPAPERGFPELADVDGDGDIDLVSVPEPEDGGEYELQWVPWSGSGFGAPRTIATSPVDLNTPRCFDWDGDGDLDVLVASVTRGEVSVHVNVGGGVFQPLPRTLDVPGATTRPSMDVDGDGLRELVVESSDVDGMRTFIHAVPGTGRFGPAVEIGAAVAAVRALSFFDLDGDGDREAVRVESTSSISNAGDSRLYENLGGAGFAAGADLPLGAGARARYRGMDWDGDGRVDLIRLQQMEWSGAVTVLFQTGHLAWSTPAPLSDELFLGVSLDLADLDGDGRDELLIGDYWLDALRIQSISDGPESIACEGALNSAGLRGRVEVTGSGVAAANDTSLIAWGLPRYRMGFFVSSATLAPSPVAGLGDGALCLGGVIGRHDRAGEVRSSSDEGRFTLALDLTDVPAGSNIASIAAGQTWHFQAWYRDQNPDATSNLTDAVSVDFR